MSTRLQYIQHKRRQLSKKSYYKSIKYPEIPLSTLDLYVSTVKGDRLDLLAHQYYRDVDLWWVISIANAGIIRSDSFMLDEGLEIRIPGEIQQVLLDFEQLNK